jgi:hypothetical protein
LSKGGMSEDGVQGLIDALFELISIKSPVCLVFFVLLEVKLPVRNVVVLPILHRLKYEISFTFYTITCITCFHRI